VDDTSSDQDDQDPGDEESGDGNRGAAGDSARLDDLGDRIESARAQAEEHVEGVAEPEDQSAGAGAGGDGDEETFADSGDDESEDDQTIAPG